MQIWFLFSKLGVWNIKMRKSDVLVRILLRRSHLDRISQWSFGHTFLRTASKFGEQFLISRWVNCFEFSRKFPNSTLPSVSSRLWLMFSSDSVAHMSLFPAKALKKASMPVFSVKFRRNLDITLSVNLAMLNRYRFESMNSFKAIFGQSKHSFVFQLWNFISNENSINQTWMSQIEVTQRLISRQILSYICVIRWNFVENPPIAAKAVVQVAPRITTLLILLLSFMLKKWEQTFVECLHGKQCSHQICCDLELRLRVNYNSVKPRVVSQRFEKHTRCVTIS